MNHTNHTYIESRNRTCGTVSLRLTLWWLRQIPKANKWLLVGHTCVGRPSRRIQLVTRRRCVRTNGRENNSNHFSEFNFRIALNKQIIHNGGNIKMESRWAWDWLVKWLYGCWDIRLVVLLITTEATSEVCRAFAEKFTHMH